MFLKPFAKYSVIANFFSYTSVRAFISLFISILIWFIFGEKFIKILSNFQKKGSVIRDLGQEYKEKKQKTPTAGGIFILLILTFNILLWCDLRNPYILLLLFVGISYGLLGFFDDYLKIKNSNYLGVSAKTKLICQCVLSIIISISIINITSIGDASNLNIPFIKNCVIDIGYLYPLFVFFVVVGSSNAVNLGDGLDGLAIGPIIIITGFMSILSYIASHIIFSKYLYLIYIPHSEEIVVFCCALLGSCIGFLWYNANPAKIFMGDTGSLSIGAILSTIALCIKQELLFALMSGIFILEALSVIIQVLFYKKTKRRFFLMAPFHHHLEKKGWSEMQIVIRFWIISFLFALVSLACLKLR